MSDLSSIVETSFSPRRVIADAARATGADFEFLMRTAQRESNFDAGARARTSSAAGMFQFIEQTWLGMLSRHGERHGLGELAAAVQRGPNGRFEIADPDLRRQALDLRFDPETASAMAGELAAENAGYLRSAIGREPSSGELYAAHFLGAAGAARLIEAARTDPSTHAETLFPEAASANRAVFRPGGRPMTAAGLLARLTGEAGPVAAPETVTLARAVAAETRTSASVAGASLASPSAPAEERDPGTGGFSAFGAHASVLTPALVELLASLDAPERARTRT